MKIESTLQTHKGLHRAENQDHGLVDRDIALFIVADGMGGHKGGETASRMATEGVSRLLKQSFAEKRTANPGRQLMDAVSSTNGEIHSVAEETPTLRGMGTTLTAAWLPWLQAGNSEMLIAQVGDSRCYLYSPGFLWQLTEDHSYVQSLVNANIIAPEDARTHPERNRINRSLGYEDSTEIDLIQFQPTSGQTLLLCSDGLNSLVEDPQIFEILEKHLKHGKPDQAAGDAALNSAALELIDAANTNGGNDNITVVLLRLHD